MRKQLSVSRGNRGTIRAAEIAAREDDLSFSDFVADALRDALRRRARRNTGKADQDA